MKITPFFIIIVIALFAACNKPAAPASPYYIKATINGTNVTFSNYTQAINQDVGLLNMFGYNSDSTASSDGILLTAYYDITAYNTQTPVSVGVYTDTANELTSSINYWNPYHGNIILQQLGTDYTINGIIDDTSSTPFTINITALDSLSVSGTFYGTVYFGTTSKTITNGSFYVPF